VYFVAETDKDSAGAAMTFERSLQRFASVVTIPRAREVGQSYATSIWSTLKAARAAYKLVQDESPDVILVNGPGVCVPVVIVAFLSQIFCVGTAVVPATAYIESFTCVSHLSLSGKVLRWLVDQFAVQWPQLKQGDWSLVGPFAAVKPSTEEVLTPMVANVMAVVTVGSTKFDSLMREISSPSLAVVRALQQLGVSNLLIQKGRSDFKFEDTWCAAVRKELGITVEVVEYRKNIAELFPRARVIISHAGAGTVLEAMRVGVPTVVVPNTDLMNNHQQELAEELGAKMVLLCAQCANLSDCLDVGRLGALRKFPDVPKEPYAALFNALVTTSEK
jgi:beta-1,4-N-acetylglucosaminyltransferase